MAEVKMIFSIFLLLTMISCQNDLQLNAKNENQNAKKLIKKKDMNQIISETIVLSKIHPKNLIICKLDSDQLNDSVLIVQNTINQKYGLKIIFGNLKISFLGMGQDFINQGFDDINWVGVFKKVPKGEIFWSNVNDDGEIIGEDEVKNSDKIKLKNDGIFIHQAESCGGGIIYWEKEEFKWIQQE